MDGKGPKVQVNDGSGKTGDKPVLITPRLILRELGPDDGAFILRLLNEPSFLQFVGDKGLRTIADAIGWIEQGPRATYVRHGYGLYLVTLRESGEPIGICGLVNREWLEDPDLGFSLLPPYWSRGYAMEAAKGVIHRAIAIHALKRILAITTGDNASSIRLLEKLGFTFQKLIRTPDGKEELSLWSRTLLPSP